MNAIKNIFSLRIWVMVLASSILLTFSAEAQTKPKPKAKPKGKVVNSKSRAKTASKKPVRSFPVVSSIMVSNPTVVRSQAAFAFTNRWFDFGDIVQGDKITHTFSFKNTGKDPLVISAVQPTCGCTVTEWDRKPIPPGQSGSISVTFDSKSALNQQSKTVTIVSNASTGNERLYLRGNVLPKR